MTVVWFILDSLHASYASVLAALHAATAAKSSGTTVQSIRDCAYDANLKLVKARITDAERTGALAELAHDQEGIGVFVQQMRNIDAHQEMAFCQLGEQHPTIGAVITDYYVKGPYTVASLGALPVARTSGTGGRNFRDAVNWEEYNNIVGRATTSVHTWILDDCFMAANSGFASNSNALIAFTSGVNAANPNRWRFDYPGHRGTHWGAVLLGSAISWTDTGGDVWSCTLPFSLFSRINSPKGFFFRDLLPGDGSAGGDYGALLDSRATLTECQNEVDTVFATPDYTSGSTFYVHMPPGQTPENRILATPLLGGALSFGYPSPIANFLEIYEEYSRCENYGRFNFPDTMRFLRGLNGNYGLDRKGSALRGWLMAMERGGASSITGPFIDGCRLAEGSLGIFINRGANGKSDGMVANVHIVDFDARDIGGKIIDHIQVDGHALAIQGGLDNFTLRGKLHAVRCGGPITFYAFNNKDPVAANVYEQGFPGLDIDCDDVLLKDHSTHWQGVGSNSSDVGLHINGDGDIVGDFTGISIKMSGTISGFRHQIRLKPGTQIPIEAHTQDSLLLEKGSYVNSDGSGIATQLAGTIRQVTLSGATGNWNIEDIIEQPGVPGVAWAIVTRVIGTNPTPTIQYRFIQATAPAFVDTNAFANLSDTGAGTVNGAESLIGALVGNPKLRKIKFAADLDVFHTSSSSVLPNGNAADRNAPGQHIDMDLNTFVGPTTGKCISVHGVQDLPGWQANSASDNVYDPNSTNPSV